MLRETLQSSGKAFKYNKSLVQPSLTWKFLGALRYLHLDPVPWNDICVWEIEVRR
jgi:hypothetical protein